MNPPLRTAVSCCPLRSTCYALRVNDFGALQVRHREGRGKHRYLAILNCYRVRAVGDNAIVSSAQR